MSRIPFDSLTLRAVVDDCRVLVGLQLEHCIQTDSSTLVLYVGEHRLLLSCDARFFRAHLSFRRHKPLKPSPPLAAYLEANLVGAKISKVRQIGFDRVFELELTHNGERHRLIAELMGKHSNLILVNPSGRVAVAAKIVGTSKSRRPVLAGRPYDPPPFPPRPSLLEAKPDDDFDGLEGASRFLSQLMQVGGLTPPQLKDIVARKAWTPCESPEFGCYPLDVGPLGLPSKKIGSLSNGIEAAYAALERTVQAEDLRRGLTGQLERVALAREVAIGGLHEALDTAARAGRLQRMGELLLAHGHSIEPGVANVQLPDYDGTPVKISLNPELGFQQNAERFFNKAKRAKAGAPHASQRLATMTEELNELRHLLKQVGVAGTIAMLQELQAAARQRRWLHEQTTPEAKAESIFGGKRIREITGPHGFDILYGENAEANDFLTLRVAKPDDVWLHVRGATSAHVVIRSRKQPDRIPRDTLEYAASVAVLNSSQKHSSYVPVDYTLKKYVRKPRGSAVGAVTYEREKTIHVEKATLEPGRPSTRRG